MVMNALSKECWRLRCSKVVMVCPAEGVNGIPTRKCISSGKGKFKMSWYTSGGQSIKRIVPSSEL